MFPFSPWCKSHSTAHLANMKNLQFCFGLCLFWAPLPSNICVFRKDLLNPYSSVFLCWHWGDHIHDWWVKWIHTPQLQITSNHKPFSLFLASLKTRTLRSITRYIDSFMLDPYLIYNNTGLLVSVISRVSCQKGPARHVYAWQIRPFWQDTFGIL